VIGVDDRFAPRNQSHDTGGAAQFGPGDLIEDLSRAIRRRSGRAFRRAFGLSGT
jgi:hypothetical protein